MLISVLISEQVRGQAEGHFGATGSKDFATINTQRKQFLVHVDSVGRGFSRIEALCDEASSAKCGKHLQSYHGLLGTLLSDRPAHTSNEYLWFPVALESGEHLFLRVPRWRRLENPFDVSEHIIDVQDLNRARAMVGGRLFSAIDLSVAGYEIESGNVVLILDNGMRLSLEAAIQKEAFLNNFVPAHGHSLALAVLADLDVRQLGEDEWRVRPNAADSMLVYGELILGKANALQMVVSHKGGGAVYFNAIEVELPSHRGQPIYKRTFEMSDIDQRTDLRGGIVEQARVVVAIEEMRLLTDLTETAAHITLDGRYPVTGEIEQYQASQLKALLDLYKVIDQPAPIKLAEL